MSKPTLIAFGDMKESIQKRIIHDGGYLFSSKRVLMCIDRQTNAFTVKEICHKRDKH